MSEQTTTRPPAAGGGPAFGPAKEKGAKGSPVARAKAWLQRNRTAALVGGAGVVGGLALFARNRAGGQTEATTAADPLGAPGTSGGYLYGGDAGVEGYATLDDLMRQQQEGDAATQALIKEHQRNVIAGMKKWRKARNARQAKLREVIKKRQDRPKPPKKAPHPKPKKNKHPKPPKKKAPAKKKGAKKRPPRKTAKKRQGGR